MSKAEVNKKGISEAEENLSQEVLRSIVRLYQGGTEGNASKGLCQISKDLKELTKGDFDVRIVAPRNRLTVMVIGNHSSGKSSFINWYAGAKLCETGQAIVTHNITLVSHGKQNSTLTSEGTIDSNPQLAHLQTKFPELMPSLETRYSKSTKNAFKIVDFIDTPGLVATGRSNNYEYPINEVLAELTSCVDYILVFFDPIQKAMIPRTLEVLRNIEKLDKAISPRVDFVLTKIDTINSVSDLLDVTGNVQGQLATALNIAHGQKTWRIYLPDKEKPDQSMAEHNDLDKLLSSFVEMVQSKVEKNLGHLKKDVDKLREQTKLALKTNELNHSRYNSKWWSVFGVNVLQWFVLPVILGIMLMPYFATPADADEYSVTVQALLDFNSLLDTLFNLTYWNKMSIFFGSFSLIHIIRRCLLQKQRDALKDKVIFKEGQKLLAENLVILDTTAEQRRVQQQKWHDHIRFSNEDVVCEHS